MIIENPHEIIQEKLTLAELRYIRQLFEQTRFHKFEGPVDDLDDEIKKWLRPVQRWSAGSKCLHQRIMKFSNMISNDEGGFIRIALIAGQKPRFILNNLEVATACLVIDAREGVAQQGWMSSEDKFAGKILNVSSGIQIICQKMGRPLYEDWVGMGAPPEVVSSATDGQRERALQTDLAQVKAPLGGTNARLKKTLL